MTSRTNKNNLPLSPIIDNYQNSFNSYYISQGFITSTKNQTQPNFSNDCFENSEILFPPRKRYRSAYKTVNVEQEDISSETTIKLNISPIRKKFKLNSNFAQNSCTDSPISKTPTLSPTTSIRNSWDEDNIDKSTPTQECNQGIDKIQVQYKSNTSPTTSIRNSWDEDNIDKSTPTQECNQDNVVLVLNQVLQKINQLHERIDNFERDTNCHRLAQNKIFMESLVRIKQINRSLEKVVGQEDGTQEFDLVFPIKTIAELSEIELRLGDPGFVSKLVLFLRKLKGCSSVESVFRFIATDSVYHEFNLNGKAGKRSLNSLKLFSTVLFDACGGLLGKDNFEKEIRKCIQHAHNRFFKTKTKT